MSSRIFRFWVESLKERPLFLNKAEAHHARSVLRVTQGTIVEIFDGKGKKAKATIKSLKPEVELENIEIIAHAPPQCETSPLTLEIAMLKPKTMTHLIETSVELGVERLQPLWTDHSPCPKNFDQDRWLEKAKIISIQAMKQCERLTQMVISPPRSLEEVLEEKALRISFLERADGSFFSPSNVPLHLCIGPEGGWSQSEIKILSEKTKSASLGPQILRAQTAAFVSCSIARQFHLTKNS